MDSSPTSIYSLRLTDDLPDEWIDVSERSLRSHGDASCGRKGVPGNSESLTLAASPTEDSQLRNNFEKPENIVDEKVARKCPMDYRTKGIQSQNVFATFLVSSPLQPRNECSSRGKGIQFDFNNSSMSKMYLFWTAILSSALTSKHSTASNERP